MSNQYYCISNTANYKEIKNVYPQAHFDNSDLAVYDIVRKIMNKPVPDGLVFNFTLDKKTIATDILSQAAIGSSGLLVSERLYQWLQPFNAHHLQFINTGVLKGAEVLQYYWMHPVKEFFDCIDYTKTTFILKDKATGAILYDFQPKNAAVLTQKLLKIPYDKSMLPKNGLYFIDDASCRSDIIFLPRIDLSIFISEKIRNCLLENKATGIYLSPEATTISIP